MRQGHRSADTFAVLSGRKQDHPHACTSSKRSFGKGPEGYAPTESQGLTLNACNMLRRDLLLEVRESMKLVYLGVAAFLTGPLAGCGGGQGIEPPRMPLFFQLNATASAEEGGLSVDCSLHFIVNVSGEVSRTNEVVEYIARMGGEAIRDIRREDGSGVSLRADAFYPKLQVLHLLPDRVQLVSLDFPPDAPSTGSRFWDELRFFDGLIDENSVISGEWLCAPLDTEQGGINDDSVFAEGSWETVELGNN